MPLFPNAAPLPPWHPNDAAAKAMIAAAPDRLSAPRAGPAAPLAALIERAIPKPRRFVSPDRLASRNRRHMLGGAGDMPPRLRAVFTEAERAALFVIASEVLARGYCDLCNDAIAARAGAGRRTVQNAKRRARLLGLISTTERPQRGGPSLPTIVRIIALEWLDWIAKRRRREGGGCKPPRATESKRLFQSNGGRVWAKRLPRKRREGDGGAQHNRSGLQTPSPRSNGEAG